MNKQIIFSLHVLRKFRLRHQIDYCRFLYHRLIHLRSNRRFKLTHKEILLPNDYLIYEASNMSYHNFYYGGLLTAEMIFDYFRKHLKVKSGNILDWGCGPGRVIRHYNHLSTNNYRFFGTDYNPKSIEWCKNNIENVNFYNNTIEAKLPFENDFFDGLYGLSIFTHLSENMHIKWFEELMRVTRKGGVLIFTTHGGNFKSIMSNREILAFDRGELVIRGNVKEGHRVFCTFHPDQFLKKLFEGVDIVKKVISPVQKNYIPQDIWILRKN